MDLASGATGAGAAGSGSAWLSSGNSSGEEDELRDGRDKVLRKLWGVVSPKNAIFPCARSGEAGFLVTEGTQDEIEVEVEIVPIVGVVEVEKVEGVVEVVEVVNFVGFAEVQGVHVQY